MDAAPALFQPRFAVCPAVCPNDDALIVRARAGERAALDILLERHRERVVNLAFQLLRHQEDAEDVAQEAFTRAFTSLHLFRGEAQFSTWLYRIAINQCLQRLRRARPCESFDEHTSQAAAPARHPDDQAETKILVEQTLDRLSQPLRLVLILREMHDLSYEEVAAILNIPLGTVRSRLSEARRKFKEIWEAL